MALEIIGEEASAKVKLLDRKGSAKQGWDDSNLQADAALLKFVREDPKSRMVATLDGELLSDLDGQGLPYFTLSSNRPLIASRRAIHLSRKRDQ
jgi:hypothetical protein